MVSVNSNGGNPHHFAVLVDMIGKEISIGCLESWKGVRESAFGTLIGLGELVSCAEGEHWVTVVE